MFKILIVSLFAVGTYGSAVGGGYGAGLALGGGGLGLGLAGGKGLGGLGLAGGYGAGLGLGGGLGLGLANGLAGGAHVNGAIISTRSIQVVPVPSSYGISAPTVVDIDSSEQPVQLNFNSRSSSLLTTQGHYGQPGSIQETVSHDEPHVLRHEVTRPVIQEIREVIVPQRNIIQEIKPVLENVETRVAKGEGKALGAGLALGGLGGGLALGGLGGGLAYGGGLGLGLAGGKGLAGGLAGGYGLGLGGGLAGGLGKGY